MSGHASSAPPLPDRLAVRYFDGRSSRPQAAQAWFEGMRLHLSTEGGEHSVDARRVRWPERTRHGLRIAQLPDGGSIQSADAQAWDAWVRAGGQAESLVVKAQQSWRSVFVSLSLLVAVSAAGYVWGLPWVARLAAEHVPDSMETQIGETVLAQVDDFLKPSRLSLQERQAIERNWEQVLAAHTAAQAARGLTVRPSRLIIRDSQSVGPNAMALPGGAIVLTDDMVRLLQHDTRVIAGVLGHELGHVQHRHGMRMLVQVSVLGAVTSLLWGDYSGVLSTVPLWLGQAHYSREAEREADAYSVNVLRDVGVSPAIMVRLFDRIERFQRCGPAVLDEAQDAQTAACVPGKAPEASVEKTLFSGLGFASHPAGDERKVFFRAVAQ